MIKETEKLEGEQIQIKKIQAIAEAEKKMKRKNQRKKKAEKTLREKKVY